MNDSWATFTPPASRISGAADSSCVRNEPVCFRPTASIASNVDVIAETPRSSVWFEAVEHESYPTSTRPFATSGGARKAG